MLKDKNSLFWLGVILVAGSVFAGCANGAKNGPMTHASLEGTVWTLTGLNIGSGMSIVDLDMPLTLEMVEGHASGYAGCNDFAGTYTYEGENLTFASINDTGIVCGVLEKGAEQEMAYLRNLARVAQCHISGTVLTMEDAEGTQLLVFEASE